MGEGMLAEESQQSGLFYTRQQPPTIKKRAILAVIKAPKQRHGGVVLYAAQVFAPGNAEYG
jgi:hypothetical protein